MARIDYSQVSPCQEPDHKKRWDTLTRVFEPARMRDIERTSEKWIDARHLNGTRRFRDGSKALVGKRISSGRWCVIVVKEVLWRAS
ncbi:hypothetical protein DU52_15430 [Methanosarcina mazei]|uniref:Uncharacterized protein n=1 Tax=Methanosarcina mazei TaxID=2209 RepID=A0A0F8E6D6_METMZ|nr:hypothetical protein DU52_15430 [Methanosarcina mazei]